MDDEKIKDSPFSHVIAEIGGRIVSTGLVVFFLHLVTKPTFLLMWFVAIGTSLDWKKLYNYYQEMQGEISDKK